MHWLFLAAATTAPTPEPIDMAWQFRQTKPPIVEVSRESAEPALLNADLNKDAEKPAYSTQPLTKSCLCSPACACGCNAGQPCRCGQPTRVSYPGIPDNSQRPSMPLPQNTHTFEGSPSFSRPAFVPANQPVYRPIQSFVNVPSSGGRNC